MHTHFYTLCRLPFPYASISTNPERMDAEIFQMLADVEVQDAGREGKGYMQKATFVMKDFVHAAVPNENSRKE